MDGVPPQPGGGTEEDDGLELLLLDVERERDRETSTCGTVRGGSATAFTNVEGNCLK